MKKVLALRDPGRNPEQIHVRFALDHVGDVVVAGLGVTRHWGHAPRRYSPAGGAFQAQSLRRFRRMPGGRGRQARLRDPRRGDPRPQRVAGPFVDRVRPRQARAGRRLHGRRLGPAHRPRGRLPRHARPGRAQPGHRGRRRLSRPRAARRPHRPGRPRADAQGVAPVHRPPAGDAADHQVERAAIGPGDHPGGRPQGVQGGRGREAGGHPHRAAGGRDGGRDRGGAAAPPPPRPPRARRPRAAEGGRPGARGAQPGRPGRQRRRPRRCHAGAERVRARHRDPGRGDVHGQGPARSRRPEGARRGGFAVRRLQHGRLRRGRPGAGDRLRPGRALAGALEPEPGQEDHLHRLGPGGDRRLLHARGRAGGRPVPHPHPTGRGVPARAAPGRFATAARGREQPFRRRQGQRPVPGAAARGRCTRSARPSAARTS